MPEVIAGRFELLEHIASGGSGAVWVARDRKAGKLCAAKVMRQSYSGELLRFVREQGVKFAHPHLLTPYGWAAEDDQVVIATDLMRGGSLHAAQSDHGAFSAPLVAEILLQLLDGLSHIHRAGWVHRDIKPANVLLETTGTGVPHVRLADFGIAVHRDEPRLTQLGSVIGTSSYLAPEVRGGADPHAAGDLYALGRMGLELTGAGNLEQVPEPLRQVLTGLLAANPARRVQAAEQSHALLSALRSPGGYRTAAGEPFEVFDQFAAAGGETVRRPTRLQPKAQFQQRSAPPSYQRPVVHQPPAGPPGPYPGQPLHPQHQQLMHQPAQQAQVPQQHLPQRPVPPRPSVMPWVLVGLAAIMGLAGAVLVFS